MKTLIPFVIICLFLVSCRSQDKRNRLRELETKRDALTEEIEELQQDIAKESGDLLDAKIPSVGIKHMDKAFFKHYIKVQGTIESDNNIFVPPQTSGVVKSISVNVGDRVVEGQLLAELDGAIFESTIAELKTNLELARTIFERQERLWKKKIGSEIQYLQAKNSKESLEKKVATVTEQYQLTKITAPIDGTVDEVHIKVGEAAAAGFGAIRIVQLSDLKIVAALSENYIARVTKGDTVQVDIPVLERSFYQTINAVSQVIDPQNRTFNIELKVSKAEPSIKPNMLAVLTINDYSNPDALTVPVDIVQRTGSRKFLFVAFQNPEFSEERFVVEKRYVTTGTYYSNQVEIIDGLSAGENVVVVGYQDLAHGQTVMVGKDQAIQ